MYIVKEMFEKGELKSLFEKNNLMRQFIYKTIIIILALIIVFEFTIGKTINKFNQKAEMIFKRM